MPIYVVLRSYRFWRCWQQAYIWPSPDPGWTATQRLGQRQWYGRWRVCDGILLRSYPSSCFWSTFVALRVRISSIIVVAVYLHFNAIHLRVHFLYMSFHILLGYKFTSTSVVVLFSWFCQSGTWAAREYNWTTLIAIASGSLCRGQ